MRGGPGGPGDTDPRGRAEGEAQPPSLGAAPPPLAETLPDAQFSLLELADRLLHRGVVLVGEATISVAGVDLIYLGLNLVISSVEALERNQPARRMSATDDRPFDRLPLAAPTAGRAGAPTADRQGGPSPDAGSPASPS
jgi:hypothetical protein